jgi:hypothetical protein
MNRREFGRKLDRLLPLLERVLPAQDYDDVANFWGQSEWDLSLDLAARLIVERSYRITRQVYDLFAELVPEIEFADQHDLSAMAKLVNPAG